MENTVPKQDNHTYNSIVSKFTSYSGELCKHTPIATTHEFVKLDHSDIPHSDFNIRTKRGHTMLVQAVFQNGRPTHEYYISNDEIKEMITSGSDVNLQDNDGRTALIWAISGKATTTTIKLLLDAGANLNTQDKFGNTALIVCCSLSISG